MWGHMNAQDVVDKIGAGVRAAWKTNQLFLGIEGYEFENADIHPEYVTTVKIAENLTGPDVVVSLETHMKMLRRQAIGIGYQNNSTDKEYRAKIEKQISRYKFGKKDSQRLDVLVMPGDGLSPPYLMAEAKLGAHNLSGVREDINRIAKLLCMYEESGAFKAHDIYGAVVFHLMQEETDAQGLQARAEKFLSRISQHLLSLSSKHLWLKSKAGLLTSYRVVEDVSGYHEDYDDGPEDPVFSKYGFAFMPGLVLLGNAADVSIAKFEKVGVPPTTTRA